METGDRNWFPSHHGSMIPSEVAALCEELHIKFMELNVMTDDDCDGSEVD